jgi:class 3 adenylate cyclase
VCVAPHARFVAGHLDGVTYVEMPGVDHWPWVVDGDRLVSEIASFVAATPPERVGFDRLLATVVFTDAVDPTPLTEQGTVRPSWHEHLDGHDALLRRTLDAFRGEPLAATRTGFVARFASAARAVRWVDELRRQIIPLEIELRTGVHAGELERGRDESEAGTVRIARALGHLAQPNEIIVSRTVADLVRGAGIEFAPRGERELPDVPGIWPILAVTEC